MPSIENLTYLFSKFPGIGARQSRRFVYFLLGQDARFTNELLSSLTSLREFVGQCDNCCRFFEHNPKENTSFLCDLCTNPHIDRSLILILEKDTDLLNIQKQGLFNGQYFVLGGLAPLLEKRGDYTNLRTEKLLKLIQKTVEKQVLKEIIFAFSAHPEGNNTALYLQKILMPFAKKYSFTTTQLGRGLSTGTELEYSDADTLKAAFGSRE